ncbi:hypothetical protein [Hyphomicrobium sp. MC8b]|uniref:hypothetical protein n=1 Tax=Hyphomicrobium sp. MC8b TaxID=300273 RepID=UPI00391A5E2C
MTRKPTTMTIDMGDGTTHEIPAVECEKCDGTGILSANMSAQVRRIDPATNETTDETVTMKKGDRCGFCLGRGKVGVAGGPPLPVSPKTVH